MRKTLFLFIVIFLLCVGWVSGWYFVANKVEAQIAKVQGQLAKRGRSFDCGDQQMTGFPFRIGIQCSSVSFQDAGKGIDLKTGALQSAAQIYQPGKSVIEFNAPLNYALANAESLEVTWQSMRASVNADLGGLDRLSLVGNDVNVVSDSFKTKPIRIDELQLHGRKIGSDDLNLAVRSAEVDTGQPIWPRFNLDATLHLNAAYSAMIRDPDLIVLAKREGLKGNLQRFDYVSSQGGKISLSGPFEISRNGILSGVFDIDARELVPILEILQEFAPEQTKLIDQLKTAAALLGGNTGGAIKLKVSVKSGDAAIG
ncbi:MAG: DUF2125 domain-containing protein, partial [Pseudomonadota bacterium]